MKSHRFFTLLLCGNLLLITTILGAGAWWTFREMDRQTNENSRRYQGRLLSMVRDGLEEAWPNADPIIGHYCRSYSRRPELRLTVVDREGRVLGDSEYPHERMGDHNNDNHPEFARALLGNTSESIRQSRTKKIRYRYAATPIRYEDRIVGAVRVAVPDSDLKEDRRRLFLGITACFTLMLSIAAVFSLFLSWLCSKPIKTISRSARQIADGNLGPIPQVSGSSEMLDLHEALDTMRRTVSRQLDTITWQRERLQLMLRYLPDAVFALDSQDRIVYYNESAERLFHLEPFAVSHSIQHVLRFPDLLDFYFRKRENTTRHEDRPANLEITLDDRRRTLEVKLIEVLDTREDEDITMLLVVNDLTDTLRTERMKADFVANTSHELRTPLTAIRMTLENALDGLYPVTSHPEVFEMLDRGVRRLEALTDDLLDLHGVEDASTPARTETTTLERQKREIEDSFRQNALEKNIDFSVELPEPETGTFRVDTKRLGLVLQNLVDNALKFTDSGGHVRLRFSFLEKDLLEIRCEDDGCGISVEEQDRVFERFYRVKRKDGNRLRGTGLGLSIVRHSVERLGASLALSGRPGGGSVFTVRVPVFPET